MDEPQAAGWFAEHWDKIVTHPLAAALAGSLLASFHAFPGATAGVKAANGISSFVIGIYLGPAVNDYAGVLSERVQALVVVACALGGLLVANAFLSWLRDTRFADLPIIKRIFGAKEQTPP